MKFLVVDTDSRLERLVSGRSRLLTPLVVPPGQTVP